MDHLTDFMFLNKIAVILHVPIILNVQSEILKLKEFEEMRILHLVRNPGAVTTSGGRGEVRRVRARLTIKDYLLNCSEYDFSLAGFVALRSSPRTVIGAVNFTLILFFFASSPFRRPLRFRLSLFAATPARSDG